VCLPYGVCLQPVQHQWEGPVIAPDPRNSITTKSNHPWISFVTQGEFDAFVRHFARRVPDSPLTFPDGLRLQQTSARCTNAFFVFALDGRVKHGHERVQIKSAAVKLRDPNYWVALRMRADNVYGISRLIAYDEENSVGAQFVLQLPLQTISKGLSH
jgi:hypothetical protein